ncbi:unnamed protein product [Brassica oleracea var. botrytis]|uniref:(rape) hypothetical protein n=1 Tax=Brassica napus TaxID=3708 RepID=A0A816I7R0_BRANA|nr:unnamed protein product [Brassica napus]
MHTKKIGTGSVILKPMAVIGPKVINVGLVTSLCVGSNSKPSRDHFSVWFVPRSYFTCLKSYPIHWNSNTFGLGPLNLHNKDVDSV